MSLLDKRYHLVITVTDGIADWETNLPLDILKIDYDCLEGGECPACREDLVQTPGTDNWCPGCQVDWDEGVTVSEELLVAGDSVLVAYRDTPWEIIQENLVLDSNGVYWVYGGKNIRAVGDNTEGGGYSCVDFKDGIWELWDGGYIDVPEDQVAKRIQDFYDLA